MTYGVEHEVVGVAGGQSPDDDRADEPVYVHDNLVSTNVIQVGYI